MGVSYTLVVLVQQVLTVRLAGSAGTFSNIQD
jgi:hypothetical protein